MGGGMQNAFTGIVVPLHMLMIDPQKQRRISHPNLAVSRHGYGTQTTIDAVHQNMQQQSNMPIQQQFFQNPMPTGNRGSVSAAAMPQATMMPHQMAPQQVIPQQMPQQMPSQIPTVPMAAPLPYGDDLSPLARQFQGMDLGALAGHVAPLRRQSFHEPFPRGHPGMGPLLNRELLEHIDEFDDDDEALFAAQFQRGHRASAPALLPPVPFYQPVHRGSMAVAPMVNPNVYTNGQMMVNPNVTMSPLRPYSYATDQSPMAGMYPHINQDLQILSTVGQMRSTERILPIVDILVQRTPTEIEALRRLFRNVNGGTDLSVAFKRLLNVSNERSSVQFAFMGLVLGPALYDSWLIQHLDGKHDDILIDIFIGRATDDIKYLLFKFQQQQQVAMTGRTISSTLAAATSNEVLLSALNIATESTRPDGTYPVDQNLVHRDVEELSKILNASFPSHTALFNILLRRSDNHIMQLNLHYRMKNRDRALDEELRRAVALPKMMRKIAVHAVRSATDPTYRDVMALRDAMGAESLVGNGSSEKLAIRICRLHWYRQHWKQVKAGYMGHMGKELVDKVNGQRGLLRDLLVAMCLV
jgi:hypothetical protein